ncbi:hypothetical protein H5410_033557 [Solanum commersonii]|uniref:Bifunctional inhibitor/plant lipid transfer protein/seed storage helical domain-containing protein n=1 Tax=Solanum commersonii TaxID=4109 RepID=A0A9J5YN67_SOLCO|nr:hypothetical protein H5410_033557 [Solanum commersonii]
MKRESKLVLVTMLVLMLLAKSHISVAATCSPVQLSPCLGAIRSSSPPSKLCCSKIKQQKPCLCQYLKNPTLKKYVNSPGAKKVAALAAFHTPVLSVTDSVCTSFILGVLLLFT